jgi:hypothetical protein
MLSFLRSRPVPEDHERGLPGIGGGVPADCLHRHERFGLRIGDRRVGKRARASMTGAGSLPRIRGMTVDALA